jgi:hypothetical protein
MPLSQQGEAARLLARMLGIETGGRAMADGLAFRPFSDDEIEAAAQEPTPCGERDAARPSLPPADAEAGADAAARLFGHRPDAIWRYGDAQGATAFHVCRWNKPDGEKVILPLSW